MLVQQQEKENIIFVDDDVKILKGFKRNLSQLFSVKTAGGAREGLEILQSMDSIPVAIVDYSMPEMTGLEFIEKAKEFQPNTRWILLTGHAHIDLVIEALNMGKVSYFLTKPCSSEKLIDVIHQSIKVHYSKKNEVIAEYKIENTTIKSLLAALNIKDYVTEGHVERVADLCERVGKKMGLTNTILCRLKSLGYMHDIGKIGVPEEILFKDGALTDEEFRLMKMHPRKGYRVALNSPGISSIADLILTHHERWDGNGYPLGLSREEIPLESRILSVVDTFDVITMERPYKAPMTKRHARAELVKHSGSQFDPEIVNYFLEVLDDIEGKQDPILEKKTVINDIDLSIYGSVKKQEIVELVDKKPDVVAHLLRNWIKEK